MSASHDSVQISAPLSLQQNYCWVGCRAGHCLLMWGLWPVFNQQFSGWSTNISLPCLFLYCFSSGCGSFIQRQPEVAPSTLCSWPFLDLTQPAIVPNCWILPCSALIVLCSWSEVRETADLMVQGFLCCWLQGREVLISHFLSSLLQVTASSVVQVPLLFRSQAGGIVLFHQKSSMSQSIHKCHQRFQLAVMVLDRERKTKRGRKKKN